MHSTPSILIIGGGFAGIRAALDLTAQGVTAQITLVNNTPYFQYPPTLYRIVTGHNKSASHVPLRTILRGRPVHIVEDTITHIDPAQKTALGEKTHYSYDYLILAVGSEPYYFHIEGLAEYSYGYKSMDEALRLRSHLEKVFTLKPGAAPDEKMSAANFMIIGAGPSGVELAGELGQYVRRLALKHSFDPALISIDLIEAAPRVLPSFPEEVSLRVEERLRTLGINVFTNRTVIKEEAEALILKDMRFSTRTVIWTAGVATHRLYKTIPGLEFDKRGRVVVDEYLQVKAIPNLFVLGDAASTPYAGLAQTALSDGAQVAKIIKARLTQRTPRFYYSHKPAHALPVGTSWAVAIWHGLTFYGRIGWWLRRAADLRFFMSILPITKAVALFLRDR